MPALAQAMSTRPSASTPRAMTASSATWLRTSATSATQRRPAERTPSAVSSALAGRRARLGDRVGQLVDSEVRPCCTTRLMVAPGA